MVVKKRTLNLLIWRLHLLNMRDYAANIQIESFLSGNRSVASGIIKQHKRVIQNTCWICSPVLSVSVKYMSFRSSFDQTGEFVFADKSQYESISSIWTSMKSQFRGSLQPEHPDSDGAYWRSANSTGGDPATFIRIIMWGTETLHYVVPGIEPPSAYPVSCFADNSETRTRTSHRRCVGKV